MRKSLLAFSVAAAVSVATAASAQPARYPGNYVAPAAGVAVGTAVGIGASEGWFGGALAGLPSSTAGAIATGGVAGVGTAALIHAAVTPCQGFSALFNNFLTRSSGECVNGQWVGYAPPRVARGR
jgi:hypothetical protein